MDSSLENQLLVVAPEHLDHRPRRWNEDKNLATLESGARYLAAGVRTGGCRGAQGWWKNDAFCLTSSLDEKTLTRFFLED